MKFANLKKNNITKPVKMNKTIIAIHSSDQLPFLNNYDIRNT